MPTFIFITQEGKQMSQRPRKYGLWNFFWDCVLTCLTGGFFLIWIIVREMRRNNP